MHRAVAANVSAGRIDEHQRVWAPTRDGGRGSRAISMMGAEREAKEERRRHELRIDVAPRDDVRPVLGTPFLVIFDDGETAATQARERLGDDTRGLAEAEHQDIA